MRSWVACVILAATTACADAASTVTDADTLIVDGTIFQLDGIEGPQTDQVCLDETGAKWPCGIAARDRLRERIGTRAVRCEDKGRDRAFQKRRRGVCWIEGETASLNQWLVREGWAFNPEPSAKGRFKADQESARDNRKGLWKGCFVSPEALRRYTISTTPLLGAACPKDNNWPVRETLFPERPAMPPGCTIKGRVAMRAQIAANQGIYHPEGCGSYARTKNPHRWFCSEEEAQAEGFRKSFTCDRR